MACWLECPSRAYTEKLVEVPAKTDDDSVKKVTFELSGAINHWETVEDTGWKVFTYKNYANKNTGMVYVKATFQDDHGWTKDIKHCSFEVVNW